VQICVDHGARHCGTTRALTGSAELSDMIFSLGRDDNPLAIYQLPARISSVVLTFTFWENAA